MKSFIATFILLATLTTVQIDEYRLRAKVSLDNAEKQVFKTDEVKPSPAKECPCGGKGYIVQGDGHRSDCPGINGESCKFKKKGTVAPKTSVIPKAAPAVENGVIIMYTRPGCTACKNWLNQYGKNMLAAGWRIKERPGNEPISVPYFGVIMNGKEYRMPSGFLTYDGLNRFNSQFEKGK